MQSIRQQVREFMLAADQNVHDQPGRPPDNIIQMRLRLITEEVMELLDACYLECDNGELLALKSHLESLFECKPYQDLDLALIADCLADTAYVVEGANQSFGFNSTRVGAEVHAANMRKFSEGSWKRSDGKHMKPPNWAGPDIASTLESQNDFQPSRKFRGEYLTYHRCGFEIRVGAPDGSRNPCELFSEEAPEDSPHRELVDNIIEHAHQPIDYIQVTEYQVFVQFKNRNETALYEVP